VCIHTYIAARKELDASQNRKNSFRSGPGNWQDSQKAELHWKFPGGSKSSAGLGRIEHVALTGPSYDVRVRVSPGRCQDYQGHMCWLGDPRSGVLCTAGTCAGSVALAVACCVQQEHMCWLGDPRSGVLCTAGTYFPNSSLAVLYAWLKIVQFMFRAVPEAKTALVSPRGAALTDPCTAGGFSRPVSK
jgi:hypothetical protein